MQLGRRRGDVLEVQEPAARLQHVEHLAVQRLLALVDAVMDREARDDEVEAAQRRQWTVQVVLDDLDTVVTGEPLAGEPEHLGREVDAHRLDVRVHAAHQTERVAVAGAEVEDATGRGREQLGQHREPLHAVREVVAFTQVPLRPCRLAPQVDGRAHGPISISRSSPRSRRRTIRLTAFR